MDVGLNTLQTIGTNYSIKTSDKEVLVYEEDTTRKTKKTEYEKLQEKQEEKKNIDKSKQFNELSDDEKRLVLDLQSRDAEVRAHESAHQTGGASTGAASFSYQQGPDGKMYAIGGEVSVTIKGGSSPQETISNAQAVIASALAPANPSGQDQAVASSARMMMVKAQQKLSQEQQKQIKAIETYKNESKQDSNYLNKDKNSQKLDQIDISS